jgi:hypothetical protein
MNEIVTNNKKLNSVAALAGTALFAGPRRNDDLLTWLNKKDIQ